MKQHLFLIVTAALIAQAPAQPTDTCPAAWYSPARQMLLYSSAANHFGRIRGYSLGDIDSMTFSATGVRVHYRWTGTSFKMREYAFATLDSMTILRNPQFTVISPNGGETYHLGDTIWATWAVDKKKRTTPGDFLYLSLDAGRQWCQLFIPSSFSSDPSRIFHANAMVYDSGCVGTYPIALSNKIYMACPNQPADSLSPLSASCMLKVDDMYDQNGCQWDPVNLVYLRVAGPSDRSDANFAIEQ
jgi:hypothetical protein